MSDIQLLDSYLSSDEAHPDSFAISDLDGFLTAIACCPESIETTEWLDIAFGEAVLSDECEPVSGGTVSLSLIPHIDRAIRSARRFCSA